MIGYIGGGTQAVTSTEVKLLDDLNGGVYMGYADGTALAAAEVLSLRIYSRVIAGNAAPSLAAQSTITGATPVDPSIVEVGPVLSFERAELRAVLSAAGPRSIPWRFYNVGMPSDVAQGSQACTIGTEHTLNTSLFGGSFWLIVSLANMQGGDTTELRLKTRAGAGSSGTARTVKFATYSGVQTIPNVAVGPFVTNDYCSATMKQTAGTGRTNDWRLIRLGTP